MLRKSAAGRTPGISLGIILAAAVAHGAVPPRDAVVSPLAGESTVAIRVRLAEAVPMVALRGYDLRFFDGKSQVIEGESEWELRCQGDRVRAVSPGTHAVDLQSPVTVESPGGFLKFRGRPYREQIRVHATGSLCEVVNSVDLEKYLTGLVNSEFSSRWNEEAVSAQVVAARTYALYRIRSSREQHFDLDATVRDQVYDGSMKEDFRAAREVQRTRGLVLTVLGAGPSPVPLKAFYHSTCAGRTELPENVWGTPSPGFRRTVACPFCASSPALRWDLDLAWGDIQEALLRGARNEEGKIPGWPRNWLEVLKRAKLLDLRVGRLDPAGRVAELISTWSTGKEGPRSLELSMSGARFRDWIGPARFRSTAFEITAHRGVMGNRLRFSGRGNGHGVGMCQYGAKAMGEQGFKMAGILQHYYPDAVLRKLW